MSDHRARSAGPLDAMGRAARASAPALSRAGSEIRAIAVRAMAEAVHDSADEIVAANRIDLEESRSAGLSESLLDRLRLDTVRLQALVSDTRTVADLPDPVGTTVDERRMGNGMRLVRRRVPLGVVGVIYEARPNVTVDIAALCIRTGNCVILRGGKETLRTNRVLVAALRRGLETTGLPGTAIQFIDSADRTLVGALLKLDRYVDMLIPRGGGELHRRCREESTIPVITGGIGICHVFVDASADVAQALEIIENAKCQRPSVCNALDTVLCHRHVAEELLPSLVDRLGPQGVRFRVDPGTLDMLRAAGRVTGVEPAGPEDFDTEWLSLVLGIRLVDGLDEAIIHIREHSTAHSDAILTRDAGHADRFVDEVDSAAVYVNASTRFTDGGQFGLGAEVAVSTQKLHARGPMGLEALTTYKWIGYGDGHVRD